MESCDFVNEEFPAEIQKFAKEQQVLNYAKYSNFLYKVLQNAVFIIPFSFFSIFPIYKITNLIFQFLILRKNSRKKHKFRF
jgi:hypothetical protein